MFSTSDPHPEHLKIIPHFHSKSILTADFQPFPILFYLIEMDYVEQAVEFKQSKQK